MNKVFSAEDDHSQALDGTDDEEIVRKIAVKIREIRTDKNLTIQQLAERARVTKGLLSKIENSRTIPSLPVFVKILRSLGVGFQDFFSDMDEQEEQRYILIKNKETPSVPSSLNGRSPDKALNSSRIQMSFLNLTSESRRDFQVLPGYRFVHLISGTGEYHIHNNIIRLRCGDALYFDGRIPHLLLNSQDEDVVMLVIDFIV